jgi:predicted RNA-binding protein with PIN domain
MIVIVDAYNVLKYSKHDREVGDIEIEIFLHAIGRRARLKKYQLIAVFDGGSSSYATRSNRNGIEVVYAGGGRSADDMIEMLCSKYRGHEVVLISADRTLCRAVTELGALCINPAVYLQRINELQVQNQEHQKPAIVKYSHSDSEPISPEEFHAMMEASALHAGVKAADKEDRVHRRIRPSQRKARSVKLLERVIEKL